MKQINDITLFALPSSQKLGEKVSAKLNVPLTDIQLTKFKDGEVSIKSKVTVRNSDVFIIASTSPPVHDNLMTLLLFIDSLKRASADQITVITPYYGYARQDRKAKGREPISAKLVANLLTIAGASKIIAMDLHNPSIQGFFDIPVDDLRGQYIFAEHIVQLKKDLTIVSPDHGGAVRARLLSDILELNSDIAVVDKRRNGPNQAEVMNVLGNVKNKDVLILDDMIDTGGTIIKAAAALKKDGAKNVYVAATHGLFSAGFDMFDESDAIKKVFVTDSVECIVNIKSKKLEVISLDTIISKVIIAQTTNESITNIYKKIKESVQK